MNRIQRAFSNQALIGYLTAGDGDSLENFIKLSLSGANVLEIGIPFSDPIADGPVIQTAMKRSLQKNTSVHDVLLLIANLRARVDAAIIVFTYLNPIQGDFDGFLRSAKRAGADGILIIDLPIEEADEYRRICKEIDLAPIFVIAPSTPLERMRRIAQAGDGFLYYACRKGTTGVRSDLPDDLTHKIAEIRSISSLPIAVGFGISDQQTVKAVLQIADGVVVGSHFVENQQDLDKGLFYDFRTKT